MEEFFGSGHFLFDTSSRDEPDLKEKATSSGPEVDCSYCSLKLVNKNEYYNHANTEHHDEIVFSWKHCDKCDMCFPTVKSLQQHQSRTHSQRRNRRFPGTDVKCGFCPQTFGKTSTYYKHANAQHLEIIAQTWVICPECSTYFPNPNSLRYHNDIVHLKKGRDKTSNPPKAVSCVFCSQTFSKPCFYYKHANAEHPEELPAQWVPCSVCGTYFPNETTLKFHTDFLHGRQKIQQEKKLHKEPKDPDEKPKLKYPRVNCAFCERDFKKSCYMYKHVNVDHLNLIVDCWSQCDVCSSYFPTDSSLKCHKDIVHSRNNGENTSQPSSASRVNCPYCSQTFRRLTFMYKHANAEHSETVRDEWHPCTECSNYFPTENSLRYHKDFTHSKKSWKTSADSSPKKFSCDFCPLDFKTSNVFYKHVNSEHMDDIATLWIKCDECVMYFPTNLSLRYHVEYGHRRENFGKQPDEDDDHKGIKRNGEPTSNSTLSFGLSKAKRKRRTKAEMQQDFEMKVALAESGGHVKRRRRNKIEMEEANSQQPTEGVRHSSRQHRTHSYNEDVEELQATHEIHEYYEAEEEEETRQEYLLDEQNYVNSSPIKSENGSSDYKGFESNGNISQAQLIDSKTGQYQCPSCDKTFSRRHYLRRHEVIHSGKTTCTYCGKVMSRVDELRSHIKRMHNESTETYEDYILENGLDQNDHYNMLGNGSDPDHIQDMSHFLDIQVEEGEENSTDLDPLDPQDIEDGLFEQNGEIPSEQDDQDVEDYLDGEVTYEDYQPGI